MTDLTDEQVAAVLDALTRPMYMWRMARSNGRPGAKVTERRALQEARQILQNPLDGPGWAHAADVERTWQQIERAQRVLQAGQVWFAPKERLLITVTRVARDARWADIRVCDPSGRFWSKRQPLKPDGWFPYGVRHLTEEEMTAWTTS